MIDETTGKERPCKFCGCTDSEGCPGGCFWVDTAETVCSSCAIYNLGGSSHKSGRGRNAVLLVDVAQAWKILGIAEDDAPAFDLFKRAIFNIATRKVLFERVPKQLIV